MGPYVQLRMGLEPSLYNDINIYSTADCTPPPPPPSVDVNNNNSNEDTTSTGSGRPDRRTLASKVNLFKPYAFRPCGHMTSESTCKYWSRVLVPQGSVEGMAAMCPFCAAPLCKEQPFVKLIFQEGL